MKKIWILAGVCAVVLSIWTAYFIHLRMTWIHEEILYRAQIARMLALTYYDYEECEQISHTFEKENFPSDVKMDRWYSKYIAVVLNEDWMNLVEEGLFDPGGVFTYRDLDFILEQFHITESMLSFTFKYKESDAMVTKKQWNEVFKLITINEPKVKLTDYIIQGTSGTITSLDSWEIMTDDGIKAAEGLALEAYIGHRVTFYEIENQLLGIVNVSQDVHEESEQTEEHTENIRVLLHDTENDYGHENVEVTSDAEFYVSRGDAVWRYAAGETVQFSKETLISNNSELWICTSSPQAKIQILSMERACGQPYYSGNIQLVIHDQEMLVINEVYIDDYVAGVVSSEMPASYGVEALKAQAVCARTYAKRMLSSNFKDYPVNVDDTSATQVYNNQMLREECQQAAKETQGIVLKNIDGYTPTYFFSTSCGHTSSPEDVWYDGNEEETGESIQVFLTNDTVESNLSQETQFRSFINLDNQNTYYEADLPWFRWQVFITDTTIEESVQKYMGIDIGNLISAKILERAESGVIKSLLINGNKEDVVVYGQYDIRQIFSPENAELLSNTGTVETGWKMLPSGYFYMDALVESGECKGFLIHGGGYGHGCGLSQNGAMKMAEMGKTYEEILECFFTDSWTEEEY